MHIDRPRFLLLTAMLATACNRGAPESKTDEAKEAKDKKAVENAKAPEPAKAEEAKAPEVAPPPSTPGTASPPGGGSGEAAPSEPTEDPAPPPMQENMANW